MINLMGLHNNVSITISNLDASGMSLASASLARFQVIVFVSEKNESRHFLLFADSEIANNVWEKFKTNSTARSSMHSTGTPVIIIWSFLPLLFDAHRCTEKLAGTGFADLKILRKLSNQKFYSLPICVCVYKIL